MPRGKDISPEVKTEIYLVFKTEGLAAALVHGRRRGVSQRIVYEIAHSENGVFRKATRLGATQRWTTEQIDELVERVGEEPLSTLNELSLWACGRNFL
jgi:hypothetical protein